MTQRTNRIIKCLHDTIRTNYPDYPLHSLTTVGDELTRQASCRSPYITDQQIAALHLLDPNLLLISGEECHCGANVYQIYVGDYLIDVLACNIHEATTLDRVGAGDDS